MGRARRVLGWLLCRLGRHAYAPRYVSQTGTSYDYCQRAACMAWRIR